MCARVRIKINIILKMNVKGVSIYVCKHNDSMNHSAAVVKLLIARAAMVLGKHLGLWL